MSNLSVFSLVACALGVIAKKLLPNPRYEDLPLCFHLKVVYVLALTFRADHFEFCIWCEIWVQLCSFPSGYIVVPTPLLSCLHSFVKNQWATECEFISEPSVVFHGSVCLPGCLLSVTNSFCFGLSTVNKRILF